MLTNHRLEGLIVRVLPHWWAALSPVPPCLHTFLVPWPTQTHRESEWTYLRCLKHVLKYGSGELNLVQFPIFQVVEKSMMHLLGRHKYYQSVICTLHHFLHLWCGFSDHLTHRSVFNVCVFLWLCHRVYLYININVTLLKVAYLVNHLKSLT